MYGISQCFHEHALLELDHGTLMRRYAMFSSHFVDTFAGLEGHCVLLSTCPGRHELFGSMHSPAARCGGDSQGGRAVRSCNPG